MSSERRFSARISFEELRSSFKNPGSVIDRSSYFATIKDISLKGVRLITPLFIPPFSTLILSFTPPKRRTIDIVITTIRISEIPGTKQYEVGAKFIGLSEEAKTAIETLS